MVAGVAGRRRRTASMRATSSSIANGLTDVVVGAGAKALDAVADAVARGEHDDRHLGDLLIW